LINEPVIILGWIRGVFGRLRLLSNGIATYWIRRSEIELDLNHRVPKTMMTNPAMLNPILMEICMNSCIKTTSYLDLG
jgi:hypothetical protein